MGCTTCLNPDGSCCDELFGSYSLVGQAWLNGVSGVGPGCPNGFICGPTGGNDPKEPPWNPPPPPPCQSTCDGTITLQLATCLGPVTRTIPYGISQSDYLAVLQSMLDQRHANQVVCDDDPNNPPPPPPATSYGNDQLCQACPDDQTLVVNGSIPTGYTVVGNSFCIRAGVIRASTKDAANTSAAAALAATYASLVAATTIECQQPPPVGDCLDLPVIPDTPCDLGIADSTVLTSIASPNPQPFPGDVVTVTSIGIGQYEQAYQGGAYSSAENPCPGDFKITQVQFSYNGGFNFQDMVFSASYCGVDQAAVEALMFADIFATFTVYSYTGDLVLTQQTAAPQTSFSTGSPNPTWKITRTKKPALDPPVQIRVNAASLTNLLPVLVDVDATAGAPAPWDGTMPLTDFSGNFAGWTWHISAPTVSTINGKRIDNFTKVYHDVSGQPTPTGCAWILAIEFVGASGATWTGYGGNGYSPEGDYVFSPDLVGWTVAHELADVVAATIAPLPANTPAGIQLTAAINGAFPSIDGVAVVLNDRVLVKDEVASANNGIYVLIQVGDGSNPWILERSPDADTNGEVVQGIFCQTTAGTANIGCYFRMISPGPTNLGVTALEWLKIPQVATVESY